MADLTVKVATTLPSDDVMVSAVQFFTNQKWRVQSQTSRIATFVGVNSIPIFKLLILVFLLFFLVIPGLIYYALVIRSLRKFRNIVITTTPAIGECFVLVSYPKDAQKLVDSFVAALPKSGSMVAAIGR